MSIDHPACYGAASKAHLALVPQRKLAAGGNKPDRNLAYEPRDTIDIPLAVSA